MTKVCLFFIILMSGCGWIQSFQLKEDVRDQISKDFETTLKKEADEILSPESQRKMDYVRFVQAHTHIEIINIKKVTEHDLLVSLHLHTIAGETRQTVLTILKPLQGRTANAFNFSEAVSLIHQNQPSLKVETDQDLQIQVRK